MAEETRVRDEEVDDEDEEDGGDPGRELKSLDVEGGRGFVGLDRFGAEEEEDPDAGADGGAVEVEDEAFEERVEAAWQEAEGACEEQEGHDGAVFGFEAFEERG